MRVSFVIVNYNRKEEVLLTISKTKEIIKTTPGDFEIVIVDNASADGSAEAIKLTHPDVILIQNPVNTGAPAWNLGFEKAEGEYFIILDDDSHIESGLEDALKYLDNHANVGILALNVSGGLYQTYEWKDLDERIGFIGCGAIFRKSLYKKIGGYADWIFLYTNEWELGFRAVQAGYKVVYFEKCKVIHRASVTHRTSKRLIENSVAHEMAIIYKYFPKKKKSLYLTRVFLNNAKQFFKYGLHSLPWYYSAYKRFLQLKKSLVPTPVEIEVQQLYIKQEWKVRKFLRVF